jgi:hypothetical protein
MIRHRPHSEVLKDLRFALEVMEEKSHLGLEHEAASTLRSRLLAQIARLEAAIANQPATPSPALAVLDIPE